MPLVVGVDSSTQSCKVEIRDLDDGTLVASGRAPHRPTNPPRSEQDPREWWDALTRALAQAEAHTADVAAVGVAGQQHGLVVLDRSGQPLRPAKLWNDTESALQAQQLVERFGAATLAQRTGSVPVASFTITKLAWLVDHEMEIVGEIANVMLPHDYLNFRLTGQIGTDRGDASGTGWYDPFTGRIAHELFDAIGGRGDWASLIPQVLGPVETLGHVTDDAAAATGLPAGIPVSVGTGDNMAAALGLGLAPGDVAMSLGTSGTVYAVSETPSADASGAVAGFADASGRFLPLVCTLNATKVTDTFARWLGMSSSEFADAALSAPPDANGVQLMPHFDGERTPNLPEATGILHGLRNTTSPADLARAAHEGVVDGLLYGRDCLASAGAATDGRLHLIGGGAHSPAYRQIVADRNRAPIRVPNVDETVAAGAAVQAAMMLGRYRDDIATSWQLGEGIDVHPSS